MQKLNFSGAGNYGFIISNMEGRKSIRRTQNVAFCCEINFNFMKILKINEFTFPI
jgi:hypothetical protein